MAIRKILPYILGLLFLAFALGSLPRGQAGGSILFNSYWLLYLIDLTPIIVLVILGALVVLIAYNWRSLSMGIGSGIARRRTTGKTRSSRSILISVFFWTLAAVVLALRRQASAAADTSSSLGAQIAADTGTPPNLIRFGTPLTVIANFVQTDWFGIMFTALLVVCGFVLIQSFRVSMKETSETSTLYPGNEVQGLQAVGEALTLADDETLDPRSRIIRSYEELISAASRLGAAISSDQTARELERNIRTTFLLQGDAIHGLTILFEEARYSLHNITEGDVSKAVKYLQDVSIELNVKLHSEP